MQLSCLIFGLVLLCLRFLNSGKGTNASVVSVGGFPIQHLTDWRAQLQYFWPPKQFSPGFPYITGPMFLDVLWILVVHLNDNPMHRQWSKWDEMGWHVRVPLSWGNSPRFFCRRSDGGRWEVLVGITWLIIPAWNVYLTFILRIAEMWGLTCHALTRLEDSVVFIYFIVT